MQEEFFLSDSLWNRLQEHIQNKYVRASKHPDYPLTIYTYSSKCEQEEIWDEVTMMCRGLVVDDETKEVVINPIPKFFNYDTKFAPYIDLHDSNTQITLKEDGFLLQFRFHSKYGLVVTSKGSFVSQMAVDAKKFLLDHGIEKDKKSLPLTYICEWCKDYPDCAGFIVTKHPKERLVCFATRTASGKEYPVNSIYLPDYIEKVTSFSPDDATKYLEGEVEGVVLKNKQNRVKVKTQWFLERHRAISHCTRKAVWETLFRNERVQDIDNIPDEFLPQMLQWQNELLRDFEKQKCWTFDWHETLFENQHMTEKALALNTSLGLTPFQKSLLFTIHKNQFDKLNEIIWKQLKPKGEQ